MADLTLRNVHNLCRRTDLTPERPILDLSWVTWIEPYALLYLGMYLRHHNRLGKYFDILPSRSESVRTYLLQQNFHGRFRVSIDAWLESGALKPPSSTSLGDIIDLRSEEAQADEVAESLLNLLRRCTVRVNRERITEAVAELVDNFVQHAEVGLAAMMAQYYPKKHIIKVAVADCGIGVKESLRRSGRYPEIAAMSHRDAIAKAFEPMVTRKHEGGVGFEFIRDIVVTENAEPFLSSNGGCVYIDNHGMMYSMDVPHDLAGVQVEVSFPERQ